MSAAPGAARAATLPAGAAPLLEAALELARCAGAEALVRFGTRLQVDAKSDGSPVTEADRAATTILLPDEY